MKVDPLSLRGALMVGGLVAAVAMLVAAAHNTLAAGELRFQEHQAVLAAHAAQAVSEELERARALAAAVDTQALPEDPRVRPAWLAGHDGVYDVFSVSAVRVSDADGTSLAHLGADLGVGLGPGTSVCDDCRLAGPNLSLVGPADVRGRQAQVDLSLASLSERLLWPVRSGAEGYAWMLGPGGTILGSPDAAQIGSRPFERVEGELRAMLAEMQSGVAGTAAYRWEGQRRLAAYAPVRGTALSVAISADSDEVTGQLLHALRLQSAAGMAFLVLVALTGAALWREQRRHWATRQRALDERLRLQEAAAHADRLALLGTLTAGVAHELRSPLTVLLMLSDDLEAEGIDPDLVRLTREAIASLRRLSTDMTDFARRAPPEGSSSDPTQVIQSALRLVAPRLRGAERLSLALGEVPEVAMDGGRLGQVVMNLVLNAAQALDGQGLVTVSTRLCDGGVCLRVEDDGPGIDPAVRPQLFEAFATTRPPGEGTGLGLYLCRAMLESAGGWIRLDEDWRDGAAFELWLPPAHQSAAGAS